MVDGIQGRKLMAEKILIIDYEKPAVEMMTMLLKQRGFEVFDALSAQSGLRMAYQHQPDLVLLDVVLPDRDGWDICASCVNSRTCRSFSSVPRPAKTM